MEVTVQETRESTLSFCHIISSVGALGILALWTLEGVFPPQKHLQVAGFSINELLFIPGSFLFCALWVYALLGTEYLVKLLSKRFTRH